MKLRESLRIGWRNVLDHPLRSGLTTLGVIIGVAAVIALVTLGASLQADVVQTLAGDNTNVMYVSATSEASPIPGLQSGGEFVFTEHDVEGIRDIEGVQAAVPVSGLAASEVTFGNDTVGRQWVTVTTPNYFTVRRMSVVEGRPFRSGSSEIVLNRRAATMFAENVTVGSTVSITRAASGEQINATVVGIVEGRQDEGTGLVGQGPSPAIYAPVEPFYRRTVPSPTEGASQRVYARVLVQAQGLTGVQGVQGRVFTYLGERSDARLLKSATSRFEVTTYDELVGQINQVANTFTSYIAGIAVISLVVGTIGITNMMLVSVTERTREIGVMKAVGARNVDILQVFLIESILLGLGGALGGVLVGVSTAYAGTLLIGLPFQLQLWLLALAGLVGVVVGAGAGLYPAWTAARTDPIEALRYE